MSIRNKYLCIYNITDIVLRFITHSLTHSLTTVLSSLTQAEAFAFAFAFAPSIWSLYGCHKFAAEKFLRVSSQ